MSTNISDAYDAVINRAYTRSSLQMSTKAIQVS